MTDTYELAWAAGFFDGEGHTGCRNTYGKYMQLQLAIAQASDLPSLMRFRDAVGCGSILGPYGPYAYSGKAKPFYIYSAKNQTEVRQVIDRLSPWLGQVKKKQAMDAMAKWDARPWRHQLETQPRKRKPERAVA